MGPFGREKVGPEDRVRGGRGRQGMAADGCPLPPPTTSGPFSPPQSTMVLSVTQHTKGSPTSRSLYLLFPLPGIKPCPQTSRLLSAGLTSPHPSDPALDVASQMPSLTVLAKGTCIHSISFRAHVTNFGLHFGVVHRLTLSLQLEW